MAHTVENLTVTCIDFRFRPRVAEWIHHALGGQSDLVALAGASKAITDDRTRQTVLAQIETARRLHDISVVHLLDHTDCGAYGGLEAVGGDVEAEMDLHRRALEQAAAIVAEGVEGILVKAYVLHPDGRATEVDLAAAQAPESSGGEGGI